MTDFLIFAILFVLAGLLAVSFVQILILFGLRSSMDAKLSELSSVLKKMADGHSLTPSSSEKANSEAPVSSSQAEPEQKMQVPEPVTEKSVDFEETPVFEPELNEIKSSDCKEESPDKASPEVQETVWTNFKPYEAPQREVSAFEKNAREALSKIWNWLIVGESESKEGTSKEYAIASTWLLRVAILIILFGIGFFLKWSINNNLIDPLGRVGLCLLAGLGMIGAGLKLSTGQYRALAQGICGCGIASLYFSIFASFAMYKLVGHLPAFFLMILVTVGAAWLAIRLNSLMLAVAGVVGGYFTPLILHAGTANLPGLFTYLFLLGLGTLWLAWKKDWKLLNFLAFIFTYFVSWLGVGNYYERGDDFVLTVSAFSAYFVLFSFIPLVYNLTNRIKSSMIELGMLFANTAFFFMTGLGLICVTERMQIECGGILALAVSAFFALQAFIFVKTRLEDKNIFYILIAFSAFFAALTVPLLLSGQWISFAWSAAALCFLWISIKVESRLLRNIAFVLYFITFGRLIFVDFGDHFSRIHGAYWTEMQARMMTLGAFVASLFAAARLAGRYRDFFSPKTHDSENDLSCLALALSSAILLLIVYLHYEFYYIAVNFYRPMMPVLLTYIWIGAAGTALYFFIQKPSFILRVILSLCCAVLTLKVLFYDMSSFWNASFLSLLYRDDYNLETATMRFLNFIPLIGMMTAVIYFARRKKDEVLSVSFFTVPALTLLFLYLSFESNSFFAAMLPKFKEGALSIVWGAYAFGILLYGLRKRVKALRYSGLILFGVTVFKIFFFDMANLDQIYRIIAFIILGITVLAAAFAYVRFRSYIEESEEPSGKN